MSLQAALRTIDRRIAYLAKLKSHHPNSVIVVPGKNQRYAKIVIVDKVGVTEEVYVDIDMLLQKIDIGLPEVPWCSVPFNVIINFLEGIHFDFSINGSTWSVQTIIESTDHVDVHALLVSAHPCPIYCLSWGGEGDVNDIVHRPDILSLPFNIKYVLGSTHLALSELVNVSKGDLILIKNNHHTINIEHKRFFSFNYVNDQEIIVEDLHQDANHALQSEAEVFFKWTELPVNIEFTLDQQTITLRELDALKTGVILKITPDAKNTIRVYANRKLFAIGELVALEDDSLAVEINALSVTSHDDSGTVKC